MSNQELDLVAIRAELEEKFSNVLYSANAILDRVRKDDTIWCLEFTNTTTGVHMEVFDGMIIRYSNGVTASFQ